MPQVWFITGASSGFGHILSEVALEKGDLVVATARRPSTLADLVAKYPANRLLTLKLDITKLEDVRAAFSAIEAKFGRIDVVVNNAGYAIAGEAEGVRDDSDARAMFETNFWGTAHVTTEAVRFLREVNPPGVGGKIFQISSLSGVVGKPGMTYYSASKFALGGYSEALAGELDSAWNIKISIVEPGAFDTGVMVKVPWGPAHPAYSSNPSLPAVAMRASWDKFIPDGDARKAMETIYRLAALDSPPLHFPLGVDAVKDTREAAMARLADVEKYGSWSDNLQKESQ